MSMWNFIASVSSEWSLIFEYFWAENTATYVHCFISVFVLGFILHILVSILNIFIDINIIIAMVTIELVRFFFFFLTELILCNEFLFPVKSEYLF